MRLPRVFGSLPILIALALAAVACCVAPSYNRPQPHAAVPRQALRPGEIRGIDPATIIPDQIETQAP